MEKEVTIDRLDIRVGVIKEVQKHHDADSLYLEKNDVGEEPIGLSLVVFSNIFLLKRCRFFL